MIYTMEVMPVMVITKFIVITISDVQTSNHLQIEYTDAKLIHGYMQK